MDNLSDNGSNFANSTQPYSGIAQPSFWSTVVFIVAMVIIMVLAVLGNSVILVMELLNKQKTSTDWLVTFMSANDLVLACNVPIYILLYSGSWETVGSSFLCGVMIYFQETFSYSSCLLLTVTAVDRYVKTCRPHVTGITPPRSLYICVGVTAFTLATNLPIPFYVAYDVDRKCKYVVTEGPVATLFTVIVFCIQATFVVMFLTVTLSYCKVALTIRARVRTLVQASQLDGRPWKAGNLSLEPRPSTHHTDFSSRPLRNYKVAPQPTTSDNNKDIHTDTQTAQTFLSTNVDDTRATPNVFTVTKGDTLNDNTRATNTDNDNDKVSDNGNNSVNAKVTTDKVNDNGNDRANAKFKTDKVIDNVNDNANAKATTDKVIDNDSDNDNAKATPDKVIDNVNDNANAKATTDKVIDNDSDNDSAKATPDNVIDNVNDNANAKATTDKVIDNDSDNDNAKATPDKVIDNDSDNDNAKATTDKVIDNDSDNDNAQATTDKVIDNVNDNANAKTTTEQILEPEEPKRHRIAQDKDKPRRNQKETQMNRTTAIMFAVTVVFVLSWIPPWVVASLWPSNVSATVRGSVVILLCRRSFMVNTCTNPLFYIGMSSTFRQRAKQTMLRPWLRLRRVLGNAPRL